MITDENRRLHSNPDSFRVKGVLRLLGWLCWGSCFCSSPVRKKKKLMSAKVRHRESDSRKLLHQLVVRLLSLPGSFHRFRHLKQLRHGIPVSGRPSLLEHPIQRGDELRLAHAVGIVDVELALS